MAFLYIFGTIYTVVGFGYAMYIMIRGVDPWYLFPINFALGPVVMIYNYYIFAIKKRFPR